MLFHCLFEHTCAYAQWAHMHRFLSVCLSVTGPKLRRLENNSYLHKKSSWHISSFDISCDGSKSACRCRSKCINVAHDEVIPTTGVLEFQKSFMFWVRCASLLISRWKWRAWKLQVYASLYFASVQSLQVVNCKSALHSEVASLWVNPYNLFGCKLQVYKTLAGGLTSTSSCIFLPAMTFLHQDYRCHMVSAPKKIFFFRFLGLFESF